MKVALERWSAWSPGLEAREDWERWFREPVPLASQGAPEVRFLPPAVRRRSTRLTKMMLHVAFDCCSEQQRSRVRSVFASRHGAIHVAVKILGGMASGQPASPLQFSHSVHNAQAGLYSIASANREASSSLAAEEDTFGHAFLEAMLHFDRSPRQPVLIVIGDEPLPDSLAHLVEEPPGAWAVALLLTPDGPGTTLDFDLVSGACSPKPLDWPEPLEFVRWLSSEEQTLALTSGPRSWTWSKAG